MKYLDPEARRASLAWCDVILKLSINGYIYVFIRVVVARAVYNQRFASSWPTLPVFFWSVAFQGKLVRALVVRVLYEQSLSSPWSGPREEWSDF